MKRHAAVSLRGVDASPDSPEAGVAHRITGITCWFAGEFDEARGHLERALALFEPGRDDDQAFHFGLDGGVAALANLAISTWALGDLERATSLVVRTHARIGEVTHVNTRAWGGMILCMFDLMRHDRLHAAQNAFELARLQREHSLGMFRGFAVFLESWASATGDAPGMGLENMRRGVEQLHEQNVLLFDGLLKIALAEAEAAAGDLDRALAVLDEGLATADRVGYRAFEAELHRARGEMLLRRDHVNPAPAEAAFCRAIEIARGQGTRSFELRAALPLAKHYQSTGRPSAAHAVLAPALEGFAPTPEFPEIGEAREMLAAIEAGQHL